MVAIAMGVAVRFWPCSGAREPLAIKRGAKGGSRSVQSDGEIISGDSKVICDLLDWLVLKIDAANDRNRRRNPALCGVGCA